ncbi:hypothetical protein [Phocaeicola faecalis]
MFAESVSIVSQKPLESFSMQKLTVLLLFCLFCRPTPKKNAPFCQLPPPFLLWHTVCLIEGVRLVHEKKKKKIREPFAGKSV